MTFRAMYLERTTAGETRATLRDLDEVEHPQVASDTVTIDVAVLNAELQRCAGDHRHFADRAPLSYGRWDRFRGARDREP